MNLGKVTEKLKNLDILSDEIPDEKTAKAFYLLLQIIEELSEDNDRLSKELQKLRDENNLLKGEQAKPNIAANKRKKREDHSSERERKEEKPTKEPKTKKKNHKIKIDRIEYCKVDKEDLPEDAEFKGYKSYITQEIIIKTDNVEYKREVYYSPSQKKTYMGKLPQGIKGRYGPGIKTFTYILKHISNVSEPKVEEFFKNVGIYISQSTISRILTKDPSVKVFHQEKADIFRAGICSTGYQQIDDTSARVNRVNHYVQILCNPYYTAYFTIPKKDRLSVLDILRGGKQRNYYFNEEAFSLAEILKVSKKAIAQLKDKAFGRQLNEEQMQSVLQDLYPNLDKGKNQRIRIMEAGAIADYHNQREFPVIKRLLSDDAPQYKHVTEEHGLCWVHDGRHYKKINPVVPQNQEKLRAYRSQYWDYYRELLKYTKNPTQEKAEKLSSEFDKLFSTQTNYQNLDERINKSKTKKAELLLALKYPEIPLHNNESELGARVIARKRDVSLHTKSEEGTESQDSLLTIGQTAKKLFVSAYEYINDRVSGKFEMPSLASLILAKIMPVLDYSNTS